MNYDEYTQDELEEHLKDFININEYLYFENGEIAPVTTYTGKHIKNGKSEIKLFNKVYELVE